MEKSTAIIEGKDNVHVRYTVLNHEYKISLL